MTATGACGCCAGVAERTPLTVQNRPGLSAIAYRIGTHADFRASMIAALSDPKKTRLAELSTRDPGDFSIALLDAWAVAADVLTFYTERLAHESYLRTARDRISLQELGRLIGYRLRPGVAAETHVAFALEPPPAAPAAGVRDPGALPPVIPEAVTLETGLRVQSIPGPGEQPQTFETVEEIEARPGVERDSGLRDGAVRPGPRATGMRTPGVPNLKPGDALLLKGADVRADGLGAPHADVASFPSRPTTRAGTGRASSGRSRRSGTPTAAGDLRAAQAAERLRPQRAALEVDVGRLPPDYWRSTQPQPSDWPNFDHLRASEASRSTSTARIRTSSSGSWVVLSEPDVPGAVARAVGDRAVAGGVRDLGEGDPPHARRRRALRRSSDTPRETTVFAVSEPLALAEAPDPSPVAGRVDRRRRGRLRARRRAAR